MMACEKCTYWQPMRTSKGRGICQRYPPTWWFPGEGWQQPKTDKDSTCGEFKAAED